jgi:transposase-like protein
MTQFQITLNTELLHQLFIGDSRDAGIAALLETVLNQVLKAQSAEQVGAEKYERNEDRTTLRNGYYERGLTTRVGKLTLHVPRHRDGSFSTELFARYQRSEQALLLSLMEMVIQGVSTRKVANITEELCGTEFSKSTVSELCKSLDPLVQAWNNRPLIKAYPFVLVDAIYVKVREEGRVRSRGVLVATGVNIEGKREILGFAIGDTESEATWGAFFTQLKDRGLSDVDIVTSDQHSGLVNAVRQQFQGVTWQRCQTHFMRNIWDAAPKALRDELKKYVRRIFDAADMPTARTLLKQTYERFQDTAAKAMRILEEGFDDATAVLELPEACRVRTRTTNMVERLNREIRRRENVIGIFPNRDSVIRLLGSVLMEVDEGWGDEKRFIDMRAYAAWKKEKGSRT